MGDACRYCGKPIAGEIEFDTIPDGEGEHLCWRAWSTCLSTPEDTIDRLTAERDALAERSAFLNRNCWNLSRDELIAKITAVSSPEWQAGVWIDAQIDPYRKRAEAAERDADRLREAPGPGTAAGRWPWPVTVKAFIWPDHTSWRYEIIESDIDTYGNASSWAEVVERVDNLAPPPGEPTEDSDR